MSFRAQKADLGRGLFRGVVPAAEAAPAWRESEGLYLFRKFLGVDCGVTEVAVVAAVRRVIRRAPLYTPRMRTGTPFRYQMSNAGRYGWVSDERGYRYQETHPVTGEAWPPVPPEVEDVVGAALRRVGHEGFLSESCLINYYSTPRARLGMHVDDTEENREAPVVSISAGDVGVFLLAPLGRGRGVERLLLESGDVLVMAGASRLRRHGVGGILPGTSRLLRSGGRVNLTVRQVY